MIVAGFHSRQDDWALTHKLRALSAFCDKICVLLDRSPQSEAICRRFGKVEVRHWDPTTHVPDFARGHRACEEGELRKATWDWCVKADPKFVVLGDTDEIPSPDIVRWLPTARDEVDLWLMDWVHLIDGVSHAIGGRGPWSFEPATTNKKGAIVRCRKGRNYRYRTDAVVHVRLEPSPLLEAGTVIDARHVLLSSPKLIHYKWASRTRWNECAASGFPQWNPWPPADAEIVPVPADWLWRWDADDLLRTLPEPLAVVGNGPMTGCGREIDAAACVVRFNNWRTAGHETHVGKRTDVWCTNCWDDVAMRPWTGDMLTVTTHAEQPERTDKWLGAYPHLHVPRHSWTDEARAVKPDNPSTGFTLLHRLHTLGKRTVVYGFDGMLGGHYWNATHIHDHRPEEAALMKLGVLGTIEFR